MSRAQLVMAPLSHLQRFRENQSRLLATVLTIAVVGYIGWKIVQSPEQALQFAFNGLPVGAVYALLAMGFTLVYSTVWFFDLYYGAAAALGAYGVFYLRSQDFLGGQYDANNLFVNVLFAAVVAGVVGWALHVRLHDRLRARVNPTALPVLGGLLSAGAGVYTGVVLANPNLLNVMLSPVIGILVTVVTVWALRRGFRRARIGASLPAMIPLAIAAAALGAYCGFLVAITPEANLYLSWGVSCALAGAVSLALYRGLYLYMRQRAKSPLIMLVASLGDPAGDHRHHHHRISRRSSPPAGRLWQRRVDRCRGQHQGVQRLRDRRGPRRLCRPAGPAPQDRVRHRGPGHWRR